ncbi:MAG: thioester domain-containing protein [Gulosibacter sp.]|uniref:thioester domain-containing protein n=1 Tax=Gulosibacter sp. TaxID=2817531 RepID=UPI003F91736A
MDVPEQQSVRSPLAASSTPVMFRAGDFEFAHWLSNVGAGPKTPYSGAYVLTCEDGSRRLAYCLDLSGRFNTERDYVGERVSRDAFAGTNRFTQSDSAARTKVQNGVTWIARNGFPAVSLEELAELSGAQGLTRAEAVSATQAAIWVLTDDFVFAGLLEASLPSTERVLALINYFLGDANVGCAEPVDIDHAAAPGSNASRISGSIVNLVPVSAGSEDIAVVTSATETHSTDTRDLVLSDPAALPAKSVEPDPLLVNSVVLSGRDVGQDSGTTSTDSSLDDFSSHLPTPVGFEGPTKQRRRSDASTSIAARRKRK